MRSGSKTLFPAQEPVRCPPSTTNLSRVDHPAGRSFTPEPDVDVGHDVRLCPSLSVEDGVPVGGDDPRLGVGTKRVPGEVS